MLVIFVPVNASILPVPDNGRAPILILVLTQLKVAPAIVVGTKTIGSINTPLHLICDVGITISGAAFAVYEYTIGVPEQELDSGVTVITPVISAAVGLA